MSKALPLQTLDAEPFEGCIEPSAAAPRGDASAGDDGADDADDAATEASEDAEWDVAAPAKRAPALDDPHALRDFLKEMDSYR